MILYVHKSRLRNNSAALIYYTRYNPGSNRLLIPVLEIFEIQIQIFKGFFFFLIRFRIAFEEIYHNRGDE